jgi:hypothetical protein
MAIEYKAIELRRPRVANRRSEKPRPIPLSPAIIGKRKQIAKNLLKKIEPISESLASMSDEQRKAVFLKIEHKGKIDLVGTGLKSISQESESVTLVIPKAANLKPLEDKIKEFGDSTPDKNKMLPNAALVKNFKTIKRGSPRDRLCGDFRKRYSQLTKKKKLFTYEIELLTLRTGAKQQKEDLAKFRREIDASLNDNAGETMFEHQDGKGSCRIVLRTTGQTFKKFVEDLDWQRKIIYFDSRPQFETFYETLRKHVLDRLGPIVGPPQDAPTICVVDSGFSAGNPFLVPISKANMLKSFLKNQPNDTADQHGHGSGISSLVSYYALDMSDGATNTAKVWIASARILDENNFAEDDESDEGKLLSNVIREAVETFVPLGVKIFNLSVNDFKRKWDEESKKIISRNSWVARTIDYLSKEFDIIFVISTGNIGKAQIRQLIADGHTYPSYFLKAEAKLLDPAQSALALTVGSIAASVTLAGPNAAGDMAIAEENFPSPFTRVGPGVNGEIKPDLVERGGNYVLTGNGGINTNVGTDVVMASKDVSPALSHHSGTSFSTPRVAHALAMISIDLKSIGVIPTASLLKALVINSAAYPSPQILQSFNTNLKPKNQEDWMNIYGHGIPDYRRSVQADLYSSLLYFQGTIKPDKVAFLSVPIPKQLAYAEKGRKRLTVTLCFAPDVQRWGLERYFGSTMKWRMFRGDINQDAVISAMSVDDDNDKEYRKPLDQELDFNPGINLRSRGTVQHATHEWSAHQEEYSKNHYTLALASFERWGRANADEIPYAVVVRLEDLTQSCQVYQFVLNMIEVPLQATLR